MDVCVDGQAEGWLGGGRTDGCADYVSGWRICIEQLQWLFSPMTVLS